MLSVNATGVNNMKYLDHIKVGKIEMNIILGERYRLGISYGYEFSHYEDVRIISEEIHNKYASSYGCCYEDNRFGYRWNRAGFDSRCRIVSVNIAERFAVQPVGRVWPSTIKL